MSALPTSVPHVSTPNRDVALSDAGIAVVIPAYRVASHIQNVVARIPDYVSLIVVVNDKSPDNLDEVLDTIADPRLVVVRHEVNRGVGGAMKSGFARAMELGAAIVVKIDGDGQMDPALIPQFVEPLLMGEADFTKGNRFDDLDYIGHMPLVRRLGNLALSFLVKMAAGYWGLFDPTNGYLALRTDSLRRINFTRLEERYFFEISLLCEAYFSRAVLKDVPMKPVYAGEPSSLSPVGAIPTFAPRLVKRFFYRIFMKYFMRDFSVVSIFLLGGVPSLLFGIAWSAHHWLRSLQTGVVATTGTVVIGLLGIVLGFQLLLQAVVLDVGNEPKRLR